MKYYKNYILKKLSNDQIKNYTNIFINNQPKIIQYKDNKKFYWVRIDE